MSRIPVRIPTHTGRPTPSEIIDAWCERHDASNSELARRVGVSSGYVAMIRQMKVPLHAPARARWIKCMRLGAQEAADFIWWCEWRGASETLRRFLEAHHDLDIEG